jgi:hypothetical protein
MRFAVAFASTLVTLVLATDSARSTEFSRRIEVNLSHAVRERAAFLACANRDGDAAAAEIFVSGWQRGFEKLITALRANGYSDDDLAVFANRYSPDNADLGKAKRECILLGEWKQLWRRYGLAEPLAPLLTEEEVLRSK